MLTEAETRDNPGIMASHLNAEFRSTPIVWETIVQAHERIRPRIHRTPVLTSATLNALAGA